MKKLLEDANYLKSLVIGVLAATPILLAAGLALAIFVGGR
jgi:hypothetical protein